MRCVVIGVAILLALSGAARAESCVRGYVPNGYYDPWADVTCFPYAGVYGLNYWDGYPRGYYVMPPAGSGGHDHAHSNAEHLRNIPRAIAKPIKKLF